jgi:hypothetical protein
MNARKFIMSIVFDFATSTRFDAFCSLAKNAEEQRKRGDNVFLAKGGRSG